MCDALHDEPHCGDCLEEDSLECPYCSKGRVVDAKCYYCEEEYCLDCLKIDRSGENSCPYCYGENKEEQW